MGEGGIVIESCWDNVVMTECESAFSKASRFYQQSIERVIDENGIIDNDVLETFHTNLEEQTIQLFLNQSVMDDKRIHYQNQLKVILFINKYNNTNSEIK
jgi:hypothetical protein